MDAVSLRQRDLPEVGPCAKSYCKHSRSRVSIVEQEIVYMEIKQRVFMILFLTRSQKCQMQDLGRMIPLQSSTQTSENQAS